MAHIVFVSLYDEYCHGMRMLTAGLKAAGHRADLICFKQYTERPLADVGDPGEGSHIEVRPSGDFVNSFSYPASEQEERLFLELIDRLNPDLVGFGMTATQQRPAARLAGRVRKELKRTVMFGGPHPTTSPKWALEHADYVCRGEGDEVLLEIAAAIDRKSDLHGIRNLCFLDKKGEMVENVPRPLIENLDPLPFPDHSENNHYIDHDTVRQGSPFPESAMNRTYMTMTARGCPFHCSYCYNHYMQELYPSQPKVRERSIPRLIEELRQAKARRGGHYYLEILDSILMRDPARAREFCSVYHREIDLPFWGYTHPMYAVEEILRPLSECPNCEYLIMGIQSASDEIGLRRFRRVQSKEKILEASRTLNKLGIRIFYDMITNVPGETDSMCRENLDILRALPKPWRLRLSKISLFPEFAIREETGATKCVTSKRYRLWNALYFLSQDVDLSDGEIDAILSTPFFEEHPEVLEKTCGVFETRFRTQDDLRARLKIEESGRENEQCRRQRAEDELADIKWRRGFRQFMKISNAFSGRAGKR